MSTSATCAQLAPLVRDELVHVHGQGGHVLADEGTTYDIAPAELEW